MDDEQRTAFAWKLAVGVVAVGALVVGGFWWAEQREAAKWAALDAEAEERQRNADAKLAESQARLCELSNDEDACAEWVAFKQTRPEDAARIERKLAAD